MYVAISITIGLLQSRLDYCNSSLLGISAFNFDELQWAQSLAVRIAHDYWHLPTQELCNSTDSLSLLAEKIHNFEKYSRDVEFDLRQMSYPRRHTLVFPIALRKAEYRIHTRRTVLPSQRLLTSSSPAEYG